MDRQDVHRRALAESARRRHEALRCFTPQKQQEPLFTSQARFKLARGGNRAGKTLSGGVLTADKLTGYRRYGPKTDPRGVKLLCVSLDFSLLSENIYRKMFEPGAFKVCKTCRRVRHLCDSSRGGDGLCEQDESTWADRSVFAPPLIPERLVNRIAWLDKGRGIPAKAWLKTGATVDFRSTDQGRAKFQGVDWDWFWADEEATNDEEIMSEITRGLIDRNGGGLITATPLAASLTMLQWSERAGEEKADRELRASEGIEIVQPPTYEEVQLYTDDNVALDKEAIDRFFQNMGEEEEGVRRRGDFLIQQGLVYGREFDKKIHLVDTFQIPETWSLYEMQDPGHANAYATLYWAVDPDGDHWIVDELYMRRKEIGEVVKAQRRLLSGESPALPGPMRCQRSIIDPAAWQGGAGLPKGKKLIHLIHDERKKQGHKCYEGRHKCYKANNEVRAGIFAVKALLKPRPDRDGKPRLHVLRHCRHLMREMRRYRWERPQPGKDLDERRGPIKKDDHLMDTLRYGAMAKLGYVHPSKRPGWGANPKLKRTITEILEQRRKDRLKKQQGAFTLS